ncbi:MAG TPA: glycoside hydrolase family 57 protein, partial [Prolixibacteraceae bacterium]|nr:glycoside hydrolase family 57 protein [Prolixibacteraceae bacterium]
MKTINLCFRVHQPVRFRKFGFFDIGYSDYYYDDYRNESIIRRLSHDCYLAANRIILDNIWKYKGKFKVAFSISGTAIYQFKKFAPDVIQSFKALSETGCVEFIGETWSHSMASIASKREFKKQVKVHSEEMKNLFGYKPVTFCNTEMIYSDEIGTMAAEMGYKTVLTEGSGHMLKWRSPNYVYSHPENRSLKLLLKNFRLSDDIAFRFSDFGWSGWPLTTKKYVSWLNELPDNEDVVNIVMDYETFGEHQKSSTGIFKFLDTLPSAVLNHSDFRFRTPSEVASAFDSVSSLQIPAPISCADHEKDLSAWLGNELQLEAFEKLYALGEIVKDR